ncbi:SGNH/GDSL hydrolase family protein [Terriglobus sp. RCC_193]|uniref:SGNH/GDSL hydrolase family protein n=1 Tax=Terriglobus sp. RCC_193 TaxID=3239218 RepID=UPI0035248F1D
MKLTPHVLALCLILPVAASAQAKHIPDLRTEKIEWTWADRPESPNPALPNVLLLGDSITRAYYPSTVKALEGVANVYLFATSACSADPRYTAQLKDYMALAAVPFAVIHFNNGMHGWRFTEAEYAASLPGVVSTLKKLQPQARLVWTDTTPVRKDSDTGATNARIDQRNRDAAQVMQRLNISVDDQHALMQPHADMHSDDVHWNAAGSDLQAAQVAALVRRQLGR